MSGSVMQVLSGRFFVFTIVCIRTTFLKGFYSSNIDWDFTRAQVSCKFVSGFLMLFHDQDLALAIAVGNKLLARQHVLTTAESCTGGLVAALITEIAGSSQWFDRGFVTYSNQSKQQMLGISNQTLQDYGAVSKQIATHMAEQAVVRSHANVSASITGIAGPGGGSDEKPVGTVWFGWKFTDFDDQFTQTQHQIFYGSRDSIRMQAVRFALQAIVSKYS
jgi:nicotinamide-nucleotide amidase